MRTVLSVLLMALVLCAYSQDYRQSPNYGKRIAVFGGSFSVIPASDVAKAYWAEVLGTEVTTYGIGGAGFSIKTGSDRYLPLQVDRALSSGKDYDIFILWASTNDVANQVPIEEQNDQIRACISKIRSRAPGKKILFFSSLPEPILIRQNPPETAVSWLTGEKRASYFRSMANIPEYVEAQRKVCQELGIPFLDLFSCAGINEYNAIDFFSSDCLHLNTAGYNHIKETQARFISLN